MFGVSQITGQWVPMVQGFHVQPSGQMRVMPGHEAHQHDERQDADDSHKPTGADSINGVNDRRNFRQTGTSFDSFSLPGRKPQGRSAQICRSSQTAKCGGSSAC